MLQTIQAIDETLILFIQNNLRFEPLNQIMKVITYAGEAGMIWILLSLFFIFVKKDKKTGLVLLAGLAISYIINDIIIKNLIMRPRPFVDIPTLTALIKYPSSPSFPSGHAVSSFCFSYIVSALQGKRWRWCYIMAFIIAASRSYVGVHYVSDILIGAILGILIAIILVKFANKACILSSSQNPCRKKRRR